MFPGEIRALGHVPNWLCYHIGMPNPSQLPSSNGKWRFRLASLSMKFMMSSRWNPGILGGISRIPIFLWTSSPKYRLRTKHPFWFEMPLGMVMMMLDQTQTPEKSVSYSSRSRKKDLKRKSGAGLMIEKHHENRTTREIPKNILKVTWILDLDWTYSPKKSTSLWLFIIVNYLGFKKIPSPVRSWWNTLSFDICLFFNFGRFFWMPLYLKKNIHVISPIEWTSSPEKKCLHLCDSSLALNYHHIISNWIWISPSMFFFWFSVADRDWRFRIFDQLALQLFWLLWHSAVLVFLVSDRRILPTSGVVFKYVLFV